MDDKKDRYNVLVSLTEKGFSLVEMLVVCVLIGIMISIGTPALRNVFFDDPVKTTARKIIGLVNRARELAISEQQPYFLYISRLENRLWYEKDLDVEEGEGDSPGILRLPEEIRIEEILTAGKDVSAMEQVAVWITRQGHMHETSIRFADDKGQVLTLRFSPFVDTVQVIDGQGKAIQ